MKRHDVIDLWAFAARELGNEDQKFAEAHLLDCPDCQATLLKVQVAQGVLGDARLVQPQLSLAKTDAALAKEISKRLLKKARPVRWGLVMTPVAVTAVALVAVGLSQWPMPVNEVVSDETLAVAPAPGSTQVERAVELVRAGDGKSIARGGRVNAGEVLATGAKGTATLKLPDTSKLRLAASTRLALTRASSKSVELKLEQGRVAVHAAHVPREAFTVRSGDVTVVVLGTTFAVMRGPDWVEVAVSEGRVGVESPRGLPFFVSAGERVRVGTKTWRPVSRAITGAVRDELREVSPAVPAAGGPAPVAARPAAAAPVPQQPEALLTVPLVMTPLEAEKVGAPVQPPEPKEGASGEWEQPLPSRAPIGLRGIAEPNPPAPPAPPAAASPEPRAPSPEQLVPAAPVKDPAPQAPAPPPSAKPAVEVAPAAVRPERPQGVEGPAPADTATRPPASLSANGPVETRGPMPEDLEELFLMRAERSLRNGGCDRYLLGLADIAEDPLKTVRQERARIAMGRCQNALGQPEAAALEFARYVRDFPRGLFAREATAWAAAHPAVAK